MPPAGGMSFYPIYIIAQINEKCKRYITLIKSQKRQKK